MEIIPALAHNNLGFVLPNKKSLLFKFVAVVRHFPLPDNLQLPNDYVFFISVADILRLNGVVLVEPAHEIMYLDSISSSFQEELILPACLHGEPGIGCYLYSAYLKLLFEGPDDVNAEEELLEEVPYNKVIFISLKDIGSKKSIWECHQLLDRNITGLVPAPIPLPEVNCWNNGAVENNPLLSSFPVVQNGHSNVEATPRLGSIIRSNPPLPPAGHLRVPGPSNILSGHRFKARHVWSKAQWTYLTKTVGWKEEIWTGKNLRSGYVILTPEPRPHTNKVSNSPLIENLEYFHTRSSLTYHVEANPCLLMPWKELWPLLHAQGWRVVGSGQEFWYVYHPQRDGEGEAAFVPVVGVHKFASLFSLMKFPYPLQGNDQLLKTCKEFKFPVDSTMKAVKKELWLHPKRLLANLSLACTVLPIFQLSPAIASMRYEPFSACDEGVAFVFEVLELIQQRNETKRTSLRPEIHRRLKSLGWTVMQFSNSQLWCRDLFVYAPPWLKGQRSFRMGDDICWELNDLLAFTQTYGEWSLFRSPGCNALQAMSPPPKNAVEMIRKVLRAHGRADLCISEYPLVRMLQGHGWKILQEKFLLPPGSYGQHRNNDFFELNDTNSRTALLRHLTAALLPSLPDAPSQPMVGSKRKALAPMDGDEEEDGEEAGRPAVPAAAAAAASIDLVSASEGEEDREQAQKQPMQVDAEEMPPLADVRDAEDNSSVDKMEMQTAAAAGEWGAQNGKDNMDMDEESSSSGSVYSVHF